MTTRVLVAAVLGAVAMFIWTSIAHMALPLGEAGIHEIPNEGDLILAMNSSLRDEEGLYLFPGTGLGPNATRQQKNDAMQQMATKVANGPSGILMYHPKRPFTFGRWLVIEFVTQLLESILVVLLLAQTRIETFGGRAAFVLVAGILAALATNVSYWNWYGFPAIYIANYMLIEIIGFLCVGIVAALVLRKHVMRNA